MEDLIIGYVDVNSHVNHFGDWEYDPSGTAKTLTSWVAPVLCFGQSTQ